MQDPLEITRAMLKQLHDTDDAKAVTPGFVYELFVDFFTAKREAREAEYLRATMAKLREEHQKLCAETFPDSSLSATEKEEIFDLFLIAWCREHLAHEWQKFFISCAGNFTAFHRRAGDSLGP